MTLEIVAQSSPSVITDAEAERVAVVLANRYSIPLAQLSVELSGIPHSEALQQAAERLAAQERKLVRIITSPTRIPHVKHARTYRRKTQATCLRCQQLGRACWQHGGA